jgi:hypothetical protein
MLLMELMVLKLLLAAKLDNKTKLVTGQVNTVFQDGGQVMLHWQTKYLFNVADIGKLLPVGCAFQK